MGCIVELSCSRVQTLDDRFLEVFLRLFVSQMIHEVHVQPLQIMFRLKLWDAARKHQRQQTAYQDFMPAQRHVQLGTKLHEGRKRTTFATAEHMRKGRSKHKRSALSFDAKLTFEVAQKVPEINMKQASVLRDHNVVVVSIADT